MHSIDFKAFKSENPYYDDKVLTNKVMPIHWAKGDERVGHGFRDNNNLGLRTWFNSKPGNDLQLDSQLTLIKRQTNCFTRTFE